MKEYNIELLKSNIDLHELGFTQVYTDVDLNFLIDFDDSYEVIRFGYTKDNEYILAWLDLSNGGSHIHIFPIRSTFNDVVIYLFEQGIFIPYDFPNIVKVI